MASDKANILIADDNPDNLLALESILEPLDQIIHRADSGEAVLELVAKETYAVVVLDVRMPTLSGLDTARLIRKSGLNHNTPIILMTAADSTSEDIMIGYTAGATDYLTKPVIPAVVRCKVAAFVELFKKTQEVQRQAFRLQELELREQVRQRSEERFRLLADCAPVMVWMSDATRRCTWFNRHWLAYVGRSMEEELGDSWTVGVHADDREQCMHVHTTSFDARSPFTMEYRLRRHDGEYRWLFGNGVPMLGDNGEFLGYIGSCIDIHDRKRAEEDREGLLISERRAKEEAERANRLKDEFLSNVSHELRTPLNAILGWATLLRSGLGGPDDIGSGLEVIERNAKMQARIIDDLLDVARIISGKLRLDVQLLSLPEAIDGAIAAILPAASAKEIRIQKVLDPRAGPVSGDPARLQQVVWNLLSNAVKFTPKNGKVQVRLERINSHVEINVTDTGEGIEPAFLPYVFDRFRQLDASASRRHGGLGLGLSIVRQLVEMHGGTVRAKSPGKGQGSTFIVMLPVPVLHDSLDRAHRVHPRAEHTTEVECPAQTLSGVQVLVVEDEPDARELVKRVLEECHAQVTVAGSAAEALQLLSQTRPTVLISDIGMPETDGFDLIRAVRNTLNARELPAIALTAFARTEDRRRALQCGFQMHVAKPVDPNELIAAVASLAAIPMR